MASKHTAPHPTDDFSQLQLQFTDPIQYDYEAIRPIVLFAETVTQRSEQIGLDRTTIGDKARCFITGCSACVITAPLARSPGPRLS